jgi:hypothetical protein
MKIILKKPISGVNPENILRKPNERRHRIKFIDHTYEINKKRSKEWLPPIIANKRLAYSPEAREILKQCTGLLTDLHELAKHPEKEIHEVYGTNKKNNKIHYKIMKSKYIPSFSTISEKIKKNSNAANQFYKIMIDINGKQTRLFGKYMDSYLSENDYIHGFNEIKALQKLQKLGLRIVKPYFGYYDKTENKSFMFYEFKNQGHYRILADILESNKIKNNIPLIDLEVIKKIERKLSVLAEDGEFRDLDLRNIMINIETKELLLFDATDNYLKTYEAGLRYY